MDSSNLLLIVSAELCALLLVVCIFLVVQNRSLRKLVSQLKSKAQDILHDLKQAKQALKEQEENSERQSQDAIFTYLDYVEQEVNATLDRHKAVKSGRDIALDIEPEAPLIHRAPALRNAMLLAEKEAFNHNSEENKLDWQVLQSRYEQIFSFLSDYTTVEPGAASPEELDSVKQELENARGRIKNLEKFKKLYFDLEDKWQASQKEAQSQFEHISEIASDLENGEQLTSALQDYNQIYDNFSKAMHEGVDGVTILDATGGGGSDAAAEIKQLRAVTVDQHKIIEGLQRQLMSAKTDDERNQIVESLQGELQKQLRFAQESETCIQLLEEELNTAHHDMDILKSKLKQLPDIKADLLLFRKQYDELEIKHHNTISENRKLQKRLEQLGSEQAFAEDPAENARLKKELNALASRYNELEEKFLDLKMQQL